MATLSIPATTWTYAGDSYPKDSRSVSIPSGARLGGFSIVNNATDLNYLDNKNGYAAAFGNTAVYDLLVVSVVSSAGSILGYVALILYPTGTGQPPFSLPNVNLTIDGQPASEGVFSNNSMPTVINGGGSGTGGTSGGGSGGSTTCNCQAELAALQAQIDALNASVNGFVTPNLSAYALKSDLENLEVEVDITQAIKQAFGIN